MKNSDNNTWDTDQLILIKSWKLRMKMKMKMMLAVNFKLAHLDIIIQVKVDGVILVQLTIAIPAQMLIPARDVYLDIA